MVRVASVSATPVGEQEEKAEGELHLDKHSYRAGLWVAKTFTNHYWAERCRRGVEKAKRVVCINEGAVWILTMVFVCFARHIEILGWWHMLQYVRQIASEALGPASAEASAWVEAQKASLARGQLRLFFRRIAQLCPKGFSAAASGQTGCRLSVEKPPTHELCRLSQGRLPHQQRHRRIRCQNVDSTTHETSWHALVP